MKLLVATILLMLVACNAPDQTPVTVPNITSTPSATTQFIELEKTTPTASATVRETTAIPPSSATPSDPQQQCNILMSNGKPGLYVISIQPVPDLVWDNEPRRFIVRICNALGYATLNSLRFVVFVYFPGEPRPRGQTAEVTTQLLTGLNELAFASWTPGLQNHVTACQQQPPVQVAVAYVVPPDLSAFHPMLFPDASDRQTFTVKCGGTFP